MKKSYFSHGRTALVHGLQLHGIEPGCEVLVPDYICNIVPETIETLGICTRYYSVDDSLCPDWESVSAAVGTRTRYLLVVHYFGIGQDIAKCLRFCAEHRLALLEDNAHGFGAVRGEKALGTFGVLGISSPRKNLDIRNGGVLYHPKVSKDEAATCLLQPGRLRWHIWRRLKNVARSSPLAYRLLKRRPDYFSEDVGRESSSAVQRWAADKECVRAIESIDLNALRRRRRGCWKVWKEWGSRQGLVPVFERLDEGDCPLSYAVRLRDRSARSRWFDWGWKRMIDVHSWPALPKPVIEGKSSGFRHWSEIVCFPIAPEMEPAALEQKLRSLG